MNGRILFTTLFTKIFKGCKKIMSDEIKDFYTLAELKEKIARKLDIDLQNEKELIKIIVQSITDNHLTPFLEYKGLVSIAKNCTPFASFEVTKAILEALKKDTPPVNQKSYVQSYKYGTTLKSIENLVKTFEHSYCSVRLESKINTHAIFRLSPLSISSTSVDINVELGPDQPVAHIERFIEDPIKNNDYEFLGYILYSTDQVNTSKIKLNKVSKLIFSNSDIASLLDEIDNQCEKSNKLPSSSSLVEENNKYSNINTRNQDYKIIAMMAILLADRKKTYKWGEKPNKSAIEKEILSLISLKFFVSDDHDHGLKSCSHRISEC